MIQQQSSGMIWDLLMIGVLIPAYNEAHVIENAIEQIKATLEGIDKDHGVILAEGGSTDGTGGIAAQYATRDIGERRQRRSTKVNLMKDIRSMGISLLRL